MQDNLMFNSVNNFAKFTNFAKRVVKEVVETVETIEKEVASNQFNQKAKTEEIFLFSDFLNFHGIYDKYTIALRKLFQELTPDIATVIEYYSKNNCFSWLTTYDESLAQYKDIWKDFLDSKSDVDLKVQIDIPLSVFADTSASSPQENTSVNNANYKADFASTPHSNSSSPLENFISYIGEDYLDLAEIFYYSLPYLVEHHVTYKDFMDYPYRAIQVTLNWMDQDESYDESILQTVRQRLENADKRRFFHSNILTEELYYKYINFAKEKIEIDPAVFAKEYIGYDDFVDQVKDSCTNESISESKWFASILRKINEREYEYAELYSTKELEHKIIELILSNLEGESFFDFVTFKNPNYQGNTIEGLIEHCTDTFDIRDIFFYSIDSIVHDKIEYNTWLEFPFEFIWKSLNNYTKKVASWDANELENFKNKLQIEQTNWENNKIKFKSNIITEKVYNEIIELFYMTGPFSPRAFATVHLFYKEAQRNSEILKELINCKTSEDVSRHFVFLCEQKENEATQNDDKEKIAYYDIMSNVLYNYKDVLRFDVSKIEADPCCDESPKKRKYSFTYCFTQANGEGSIREMILLLKDMVYFHNTHSQNDSLKPDILLKLKSKQVSQENFVVGLYTHMLGILDMRISQRELNMRFIPKLEALREMDEAYREYISTLGDVEIIFDFNPSAFIVDQFCVAHKIDYKKYKMIPTLTNIYSIIKDDKVQRKFAKNILFYQYFNLPIYLEFGKNQPRMTND